MTNTADDFEADTWAGIKEGRKLTPPYIPTRFIQMVHEHGAVEAAKRVVDTDTPADGFVTLAYLHRRPDMTTEYLVVRYADSGLFSEALVAKARARLG